MTDAKKKQIKQLYQSGASMVEIARTLSISRWTVHHAVLGLKLKRRTRVEAARIAMEHRKKRGDQIGRSRKEIDMGKLAEMVGKGYSTSALAKYFGCSQSVIFLRLRELRERGEL